MRVTEMLIGIAIGPVSCLGPTALRHLPSRREPPVAPRVIPGPYPGLALPLAWWLVMLATGLVRTGPMVIAR